MDPITVISLVAACSSLAARCTRVVKTLHNIAGSYKHVEIEVLSIAGECETVEFAWNSIEAWATQNLRHLENFGQVQDRLQKSIFTCQLVVSALEDDLARVRSSDSRIKRQAGMLWNEDVFRDHRTRVMGQVASLQLLLQVMNMPSYEDRIETLSVKEVVFRKAEESVLSIVPSRLSTRLSFTENQSTSLTRAVSTRLRYIRKSFENELFTSNVYKRNYRLPHMHGTTASQKPPDGSANLGSSQIWRYARYLGLGTNLQAKILMTL
jgi:hypothetical protein